MDVHSLVLLVSIILAAVLSAPLPVRQPPKPDEVFDTNIYSLSIPVEEAVTSLDAKALGHFLETALQKYFERANHTRIRRALPPGTKPALLLFEYTLTEI